MSIEAIAYVVRFSPYRGAAFTVHFALADSANDQYGYRLWMRQGKLAVKARCSRSAVNEVLERMVSDGFIELLADHRLDGKPNEYRFLFPKVPVAYDSQSTDGRGGVATDDTPVSPDATPVSPQTTGGVATDDTEPERNRKSKERARITDPPEQLSDGEMDRLREWAREKGHKIDVDDAVENMLIWHRSTGARRRDWYATAQRWIRTEREREPEPDDTRPRDRALDRSGVMEFAGHRVRVPTMTEDEFADELRSRGCGESLVDVGVEEFRRLRGAA